MRLQIHTAGVEKNALADQGDIRRACRFAPSGPVFQVSDARNALLVRGGYGQKRVRPQASQRFFIQPFEAETMVAGQFANRTMIAARVEYVGWECCQPTRQIRAASDGRPIARIATRIILQDDLFYTALVL